MTILATQEDLTRKKGEIWTILATQEDLTLTRKKDFEDFESHKDIGRSHDTTILGRRES